MTLRGMSSAKRRDSRSKRRAAGSELRVVQSRSDEGLARKKNQGSIVRTHILHAFHTHRSAKQVRVVRTHRSKSNEQQCSHRPHLLSSVAQHAPCFGRREKSGSRCEFRHTMPVHVTEFSHIAAPKVSNKKQACGNRFALMDCTARTLRRKNNRHCDEMRQFSAKHLSRGDKTRGAGILRT